MQSLALLLGKDLVNKVVLIAKNVLREVYRWVRGRSLPFVPFWIILAPERLQWVKLKEQEVFLTALQRGKLLVFVDDECMSRDFMRGHGSCTKADGDCPLESCIYEIAVEREYSATEALAAIRSDIETQNQVTGRFEALSRYFKVLLSKRNCLGVMYLQGHFLDTVVARTVAARFNKRTLSIECTFQSHRLICEKVTGIAVNQNSAATVYARYRDAVEPDTVAAWYEQFKAEKEAKKFLDHRSGDLSVDKYDLVVLGQCYTDSSLLFGQSGTITPLDMYAVVLEIARARQWKVFIKLHPKEHGGHTTLGNAYNDLSWRKLNDYRRTKELLGLVTVDWKNEFNTMEVLRKTSVAVTFNSQAGIEALMERVPVIICGASFYSMLKGVYVACTECALAAIVSEVIEDVEKFRPDIEELKRFLYVYFEKYCIENSAESVVNQLKRHE